MTKLKVVVWTVGLAGILSLAVSSLLPVLNATGFFEPAIEGGSTNMRLITTDQYVNTIRYVFGEDIDVGSANFPLVPRTEGLVSLGTTSAEMTPSGLAMFNRSARAIAEQVVDPTHRDLLVPCSPAYVSQPDSECAAEFFAKVGRFLYRRPLDDDELTVYVTLADEGAASSGDFYHGLALSLAGMMTSPKFLYITESSEPDPANPGELRLDAYSKASRLSLFLWNTLPDDELLMAAEQGLLHEADGLRRQLNRMVDSPRLTEGVRAFFSDLLHFQNFQMPSKDAVIYPAFTYAVSRSVHEQALKVIVGHLLEDRLGYPSLFTTDRTYLNAALGPVYQTPVPISAGGDEWVRHELDDEASAGILTSLSFLASHSHSGRSSPTLRGKAVREIFLCQKVPDPPPTVDFADFEDLSGKMTARARLAAHNVDPACRGCHRLTDPVGLAFERFDGAGQRRTQENGVEIDTSGEMDGRSFTGVSDVGEIVKEHPALAPCLVRRLYAHGVGRNPGVEEREWLSWMVEQFATDGHQIPDLLMDMAGSEAFFAVSEPVQEPPSSSALAQSNSN